MKTIFKVGDKVFDYTYGWGEVNRVDLNVESFWPIGVIFESENTEAYTFDGRYYSTQAKTLSFTEYTLEGFSQERPDELPEIGDVVWIRSEFPTEWVIGHFLMKENGNYYVNHSPTIKGWHSFGTEIRTTNPFKK